MKEIIIYLHTSEQTDSQSTKPWLPDFTKNLSSSLNRFGVNVNAITSQENVFFNAINGRVAGCYLPIINRQFTNSGHAVSQFNNVISKIEDSYKNQAINLSLIEEVLAMNHANYQPLYKFFNQGQFNQGQAGRIIESHLPGNNNYTSFQFHINNIAKEISYQLLKLASTVSYDSRVFIGTSTSDLAEPVNMLYNFLLDNNMEVIRPTNPEGLTKEFIEKKISSTMESCWLCIHPFGNGSLHKSSFVNEQTSMVKLENELAAKQLISNKNNPLSNRKFKRIIWIPRMASPSTYEGRLIERIKNQSQLRNDAEILDCSLDELKEIIISYNNDATSNNIFYSAHQTSAPQVNETINVTEKGIEKNTVFVLFEEQYRPHLKQLNQILSNMGLKAITLEDISNSPNFSKVKLEILQYCCGVIIFASNWNTTWFKSNLNEIVKSKSVRDFSMDFICLLSQEIEQLPYNFENELVLIKVNGDISEEQLTTVLQNKGNLSD